MDIVVLSIEINRSVWLVLYMIFIDSMKTATEF